MPALFGPWSFTGDMFQPKLEGMTRKKTVSKCLGKDWVSLRYMLFGLKSCVMSVRWTTESFKFYPESHMQRDMSFTCHANAQTYAKSGFEQLKELRASYFYMHMAYVPTTFHVVGFVFGCSMLRVFEPYGFKVFHIQHVLSLESLQFRFLDLCILKIWSLTFCNIITFIC